MTGMHKGQTNNGSFKKGHPTFNHGGYKLSETIRKKLSKAHFGFKTPEETKLKISISNKKHYKEHPERRIRKKGKENKNWRGGSVMARRRWIETHRQKKYYLNAQRRALKKNAEGTHTFGEWELLKKQYGYICLACKKKEPDIILTEDHIIPLSKGGSNYIENIQPLCKNCNSRKNTEIKKYG